MKKLRTPTKLAARTSLVNVLRNRQTKISNLIEKYFTVVGSGSIGDKAQELMDKAWAIEQAGFVLNLRTILSMGFFEDFLRRSGVQKAFEAGDHSYALTNRIHRTKFTKQESRVLRRIFAKFKDSHLVVRSSAHGDSKGTGVYESKFVYKNKKEHEHFAKFLDAIKLVVASQFREVAINFREKHSLEPGMAVIIEPVFGQDLSTRSEQKFAPLFGGFAYSSCFSTPNSGYAFFTAGLPTLAVQGKGVKIKETSTLSLAIEAEMITIQRSVPGIPPKNYSEHGEYIRNSREPEGRIKPSHLSEESMTWFFDKLRKLEKILGKPQYIEWAVTLKDGEEPQVCILQISDVPITLDKDLPLIQEIENTIVSAIYCIGSGTKVGKDIAVVMTDEDLEAVEIYNRQNQGHVLFFNGALISNDRKITPIHSSNASVLVEVPFVLLNPFKRGVGLPNHSEPPEGHVNGFLKANEQFYLMSRYPDYERLLPYLERIEVAPGRFLNIFRVNFEALANEQVREGVINLLE